VIVVLTLIRKSPDAVFDVLLNCLDKQLFKCKDLEVCDYINIYVRPVAEIYLFMKSIGSLSKLYKFQQE